VGKKGKKKGGRNQGDVLEKVKVGFY